MKKSHNISQSLIWAVLATCTLNTVVTAATFSNIPLVEAISKGNTSEVIRLLNEGADPISPDSSGSTSLHWAAWFGHKKIAKLLLDKGANPNAHNQATGWTPLFDALNNNKKAIVQLLLDHGADPTIKDSWGNTASYFARGKDEAGPFFISADRTEIKKLLQKAMKKHAESPRKKEK